MIDYLSSFSFLILFTENRWGKRFANVSKRWKERKICWCVCEKKKGLDKWSSSGSVQAKNKRTKRRKEEMKE